MRKNIAVSIVALIIQKPKILLLIVPLLVLGYLYEIFIARPTMFYMGTPQAISSSLSTWTHIVRNDDFAIGYNILRGNPLWVSYRLTQIPKNAPRLKRPDAFKSDWRSFNALDSDDYTHSGYDRGHMAPNYAISTLYGKASQEDTFLMSNITPQKPNLNRKLWQRLEMVEADYFTKVFDSVWVVTGPIFDSDITRLKSSFKVQIPDGFFKIYIGLKGNQSPKALAFIMPQNVTGHEPLTKYIATVDEVEQQSGFDFFVMLDDRLENAIESSKDIEPWRLKSLANIQSKY
jgi:endonuclease G